MSFIDLEITRRQFTARYVNVGRCMLDNLANMYGVDLDIATNWADAIDREAEQIAAATAPRSLGGGGIEGAATPPAAAPSSLPSSAAFGSHGGPGAADLSPAAPAYSSPR